MSNNAPIVSQEIKSKVIQNSWNYIFDNFHKFTEANKIKVVLAIIAKDMPSKLEGEGFKGETKVVVMIDNAKENGNQSKEGRLPASVVVEPS